MTPKAAPRRPDEMWTTPEFARWLNGSLTRFCGHGMHDRCRGTIRTIGIECPCLCKCHGVPRGA